MTAISTQSTLQKSLNSRRSIADQDRQLQKAQQEMVTGLREDVYADAGFRAAQSLDLRNRMSRIESFATSNKLLAGKLEMMSSQMSSMRNQSQEFSALAVSLGNGTQGRDVLAVQANALIQSLASQINTSYSGEFLFSGVNSDKASLSLTGTTFATPPLPAGASLSDVNATLAAFDSYFGLNGAPPAANGYASLITAGEQQSATVDQYTSLGYGMGADDEAFALIFKGLAMFANTDITQITDADAYRVWVDAATDAIVQGTNKLQREETILGNQQSLIDQVTTRQATLANVYNERVLDIEGVDSYEAATRLESMSAQLDASYAVTVRLKNLSLLNYL